MKRMWMCGLAIVSLCPLVARPLRAGTVLVGEEGKLPGGPVHESSILIGPKALRMSIPGADAVAGQAEYMIFRADKQLMWAVLPDKRQYFEMDRQAVTAMGQQVSAAMAMLQGQLAQMPPEQRGQMEGMLKGLGVGGGASPQPLVEKVGSGEKVGSWSCDHYSVKQPGGAMLHEQWCAPIDDGGIPPAEAGVLRQMNAFGEEMGRTVSDALKGALPGFEMPFEAGSMKGLPVRWRSYDAAGNPDSQWELKAVKQQAIPDEMFEIPAGFTRQTPIPEPPMSGRGLPGARPHGLPGH